MRSYQDDTSYEDKDKDESRIEYSTLLAVCRTSRFQISDTHTYKLYLPLPPSPLPDRTGHTHRVLYSTVHSLSHSGIWITGSSSNPKPQQTSTTPTVTPPPPLSQSIYQITLQYLHPRQIINTDLTTTVNYFSSVQYRTEHYTPSTNLLTAEGNLALTTLAISYHQKG